MCNRAAAKLISVSASVKHGRLLKMAFVVLKTFGWLLTLGIEELQQVGLTDTQAATNRVRRQFTRRDQPINHRKADFQTGSCLFCCKHFHFLTLKSLRRYRLRSTGFLFVSALPPTGQATKRLQRPLRIFEQTGWRLQRSE